MTRVANPAAMRGLGVENLYGAVKLIGGVLKHSIIASSAAIANSAAETAFDQTLSLGANDLNQVGALLRIRASGIYSVTGTPTITLKFRIDGTGVDGEVLAELQLTAPSGVSNFGWALESSSIVRALGTAITLKNGFAIGGLNGVDARTAVKTTAVSIDSQAPHTIYGTVQFGAADPANTITLETFTAEVLYPGRYD